MNLTTHDNIKIQHFNYGEDCSPIIVVDDFVNSPNWLIEQALQKPFNQQRAFYPGSCADAPSQYKTLFLNSLQDLMISTFNLPSALCFSACQYSVVTTPPEQLKLLQRIPHFDSLNKIGLAAVHYLFKQDLGGTSFYRHRKTGFEYIDESRKIEYFRSLEAENDGPHMPKIVDGYINGDTALYERIAEQQGLFNRLIIYRRNSLHSGSIRNELFNANGLIGGRLTINSFIDCR
jgi:hypothetical protein